MEQPPTNKQGTFVTLFELADATGIDAGWLAKEVAAGRLPHLAARRTIYFDAPFTVRLLRRRARECPPCRRCPYLTKKPRARGRTQAQDKAPPPAGDQDNPQALKAEHQDR